MGRRKKEPKSVHREKIATAASALFMEKGIAATSMDDIAKAAGYSKATKARHDGSKLKKLGWTARYDIKQGLERTMKMLTEISE